jgi:hypothetical protein
MCFHISYACPSWLRNAAACCWVTEHPFRWQVATDEEVIFAITQFLILLWVLLHCLKSVRTFGLMFLVHGCNLNHLALKPELESGFCFGLRMGRGGHLSKWPLRGIHRWANVRKFSTTASQSIHSAELINLREQIRRYARSSLLLCAICEFVRFCRGRWQTPSLNHLIGIESPHGLKRHVELLFIR